MPEEKKLSIDEYLEQIRHGANATAAKEYLDNYLWVKMWSILKALTTCEPTLEELLNRRAELKAHMQIAQQLMFDIDNAEAMKDRLKKAYTPERSR